MATTADSRAARRGVVAVTRIRDYHLLVVIAGSSVRLAMMLWAWFHDGIILRNW